MLSRSPDYHDSFRATRAAGDTRPALEWFRAAFEGAALPLRWFLVFGWRVVLFLKLDAPGSAGVLGWSIVEDSPACARIGAESPLMTARLTVEVSSEDVAEWSTDLWFRNTAGRLLWVGVGVLHRVIVPYRLNRASYRARDRARSRPGRGIAPP